MDIIEALIVSEAVYKVEGRKARELLAYFANKVFKQNWTVATEKMEEEVVVDEEEAVLEMLMPCSMNLILML